MPRLPPARKPADSSPLTRGTTPAPPVGSSLAPGPWNRRVRCVEACEPLRSARPAEGLSPPRLIGKGRSARPESLAWRPFTMTIITRTKHVPTLESGHGAQAKWGRGTTEGWWRGRAVGLGVTLARKSPPKPWERLKMDSEKTRPAETSHKLRGRGARWQPDQRSGPASHRLKVKSRRRTRPLGRISLARKKRPKPLKG